MVNLIPVLGNQTKHLLNELSTRRLMDNHLLQQSVLNFISDSVSTFKTEKLVTSNNISAITRLDTNMC